MANSETLVGTQALILQLYYLYIPIAKDTNVLAESHLDHVGISAAMRKCMCRLADKKFVKVSMRRMSSAHRHRHIEGTHYILIC